MKKIFILSVYILLIVLAGCGQNKKANTNTTSNKSATPQVMLVGEGCDGCELIYVGMPAVINPVDTSPGWKEEGQKLLVNGMVFKHDGKTPAPGIIVYYHHTNNKGYYAPSPTLNEKARRHGHIRGWVKTDANGRFKIYTIKPGPYPGRTLPSHIHITIKEPGINEYYIDDINFNDDPLLTDEMRQHREKRGGDGIVTLSRNKDGLLECTRNIILGENIPNYPGASR